MSHSPAEYLASLSFAQRAELEHRLLRQRAPDPQVIGQQNGLSHAPLSFAQRRQWFFHQLHPDSPLYNIPRRIRLRGSLDLAALRQTFDAITGRHSVLRATFGEADGEPLQRIVPGLQLPLPVVDLSTLPDGERGAETRRLAREEARTPFDLARGPLLRTQLLRLGDQEHLLLLTLHHIVSDGWSTGVLLNELAALYEAFVAGTAPTLPELPIQYTDYAVWQRERLQGKALDLEGAYWRKQLQGCPTLLELPTDRPRRRCKPTTAPGWPLPCQPI